MKGRINSEDKIQPFQIADTVLKDTKNILSCEVIKIEDKYVIHLLLCLMLKSKILIN